MAETNENPPASESSESKTQAEQNVNAEPPKTTEQPEISKDARMWAMFCHLAGLAGYVMPVVGNVVGPLILWQIKKDEYEFVDKQGKEALNFQISMSLYIVIGSALCVITCIGAVLIPVVGVVVGIIDLVFLLIAAVRANNGQSYRYPLAIRFVK
jgi:uncharacterized Tic20 family protein